MAECFLGIDIGTSGVKVIAVDLAGELLAARSESFDFDRPHPGWAETPPSRWWDATCKATRAVASELGAHTIVAAGLSGQMHGSVFLDTQARANAGRGEIDAITPALMWNDQRTEPQRAKLEQTLGGRRAVVEATGCAPLCGLTAPKLAWLCEERPELFERVAGMCLPKDFVALALTGAFKTDVGDASGTMLFDVANRTWNTDVLATLGIDPTILPEPVESGAVAGEVTAWASSATGLPEGTPIMIGSGDNQTAAVGAGVIEPGEALAILGTSGVVLAPSPQSTPDLAGETAGRLNLFCDATGRTGSPGAWVLSGCMLSAAGSLEWARAVVGPNDSFDTLIAEAEQAPPGSDGLVFLPYLTGERCPIPDPNARGGWIGLTRSHTRGHLVRAVLEGVSFGLGQIMDIVRDVSGSAERVRVTGGGAKSALWRQTLANVFNAPVVPLSVDEGSALGAAAIAAYGSGKSSSIGELTDRWVRLGTPTEPAPSAALDAVSDVYARLYEDLKPASLVLSSLPEEAATVQETH